MNNSIFGKPMDYVRNRHDKNLIYNSLQAEKYT